MNNSGMRAANREVKDFDHNAHVKYFLKCLEGLPAPYVSLDTNRMTCAYFCISGLDILGALDKVDGPSIVEWVYAQQLRPAAGAQADAAWAGGFRGAAYLGAPFLPDGSPQSSEYDCGHIAMTYTALAMLTILGDDLSRVDRAATLRHVHQLQQSDGSFCAFDGGESDMRFVYCAAAICTFLCDGRDGRWEGLEASLAVEYILASQCYDGALGLGPGTESHGGSSYAACAHLLHTLHACLRHVLTCCTDTRARAHSFGRGRGLACACGMRMRDVHAECACGCSCADDQEAVPPVCVHVHVCMCMCACACVHDCACAYEGAVGRTRALCPCACFQEVDEG